jgi:hypothetical protein
MLRDGDGDWRIQYLFELQGNKEKGRQGEDLGAHARSHYRANCRDPLLDLPLLRNVFAKCARPWPWRAGPLAYFACGPNFFVETSQTSIVSGGRLLVCQGAR